MTSFSSLAKWWEVGKREILQLTKDYCVRRAQETRSSRDLLVRLSDHLKTRCDEGLVSAYEPYCSTLSRLAELDLAAAKGASVRSRIRWVEEGETSSSYFCPLEKKRSVDRWISAIRSPSGCIVSDPHDLCDSFSAFYSDLFTASPVDSLAQQSLLSNLSAALSRDQADLCEGYLGVEECRGALMGMARNKAPGSDGLPMEFYVKFWDVIGSDLVTVLNSCFDAGFLASSQRGGVISLSFKKGDRLDPRNWQPVSLLNVDYKLAARVLARPLLKVIHLVVADDQTCGVPGGTLARTLPFCGMLSIMLLSLDNPLPSFPFIRKRPSVEWIGDSCVGLCYLWASANLLLNGWTCFILTFPVLCLLMVICRLSSHCHGGCAKAVLCPRSCMCLSLRC